MSIKNEPVEHKLAYLRVKIKSLAAEARIIKAAERKSKKKGDHLTLMKLREHRVNVVRRELRVAQLASRFIRGKKYFEDNARQPPDLYRVATLVNKYGWAGAPEINHADVANWMIDFEPTPSAGPVPENYYQAREDDEDRIYNKFYAKFAG